LDSASDDRLFVQFPKVSVGVEKNTTPLEKKIENHRRVREEKSNILLIRTGPGTEAINRTENRIDGYTK